MTVINLPEPGEPLPADIWATNAGVYLGLLPEGGTDALRPLTGKENDPSLPRSAKYRTTWKPDGDNQAQFIGEAHIATFGAMGVGKSRKLLMPNLLQLRDWSIVVVDPKGELCAHTAVARAQHKDHQVFVLDPFEVIKTNYPRLFKKHSELFTSCGFNPVAALRPEKSTFTDDAKGMAMALIQTDASRDPYWPMAAQALVKGLLMVLRVDRPGQSDTLGNLRRVLGYGAEDLAIFVKFLVKKHKERFPAIATTLNEFSVHNPQDRELGGIRRTALAQTDWLDSPPISKDLARKNVIDFEQFKQRPCTLYLIIPPEFLVTHGAWLRLMITAALQPLLRSVERAPVPVLFMIDEIAALGRIPIIENNIAQMRGFGVKLWAVWQDTKQMESIYHDAWHTFMSTAEAKITFTSNHPETREYFSLLSGERLYRHFMKGQSAGMSYQFASAQSANSGESSSEHLQSERVIKPYEIAALDADEAVIFTRRGRINRVICPQPEQLPDIRDAMRAARHAIRSEA